MHVMTHVMMHGMMHVMMHVMTHVMMHVMTHVMTHVMMRVMMHVMMRVIMRVMMQVYHRQARPEPAVALGRVQAWCPSGGQGSCWTLLQAAGPCKQRQPVTALA